MEKSFSCRCTCYALHVRTVHVLISVSMFIGLDLTSTDRVKGMNEVFVSGRYLFTDFYGALSLQGAESNGLGPRKLRLSLPPLFTVELATSTETG